MNTKLGACLPILLLLLCACKEEAGRQMVDKGKAAANMVQSFEADLAQLDRTKLTSIDSATHLFRHYAQLSTNGAQIDSFFMPFFDLYNIGRDLLKEAPSEVIASYGFDEITKGDESSILPVRSTYLDTNVIRFPTRPTQKFSSCILQEFEEQVDLKYFARSSIWWEEFNRAHPDFFLSEMTTYHYKQWHLRNLLAGMDDAIVFDTNGQLSPGVMNLYEEVIRNHQGSETAEVLASYLEVLKKGNMRKTEEVDGFLEDL